MSLGLLYLFLVILPNAHSTFDFLQGITWVMAGAILIVSGFVAGPAEEPESGKKLFIWSIKAAVLAAVFAIISIPLPSDDQVYRLAGGYVATNIKDIAKLPDNLVKAANAWLEKASDAAQDKKTSNQK